ncbi:MAG: Ig-like domain-containing protein [Lachnospiraceae bacterium]|nr:Ig-like domain-containing protein [Lachnospiraceae bacterium]
MKKQQFLKQILALTLAISMTMLPVPAKAADHTEGDVYAEEDVYAEAAPAEADVAGLYTTDAGDDNNESMPEPVHTTDGADVIKANTIRLTDADSSTSGHLYPGGKITLTAIRYDAEKQPLKNPALKWTVSEPKLVSVVAKKNGEATVSVKAKQLEEVKKVVITVATKEKDATKVISATYELTLYPSPVDELNGITCLTDSPLLDSYEQKCVAASDGKFLIVGNRAVFRADAVIRTKDMNEADDYQKFIDWTISGKKCTVCANDDNTVTVTALKKGTATVKATVFLANGKKVSKTFKITVVDEPVSALSIGSTTDGADHASVFPKQKMTISAVSVLQRENAIPAKLKFEVSEKKLVSAKYDKKTGLITLSVLKNKVDAPVEVTVKAVIDQKKLCAQTKLEGTLYSGVVEDTFKLTVLPSPMQSVSGINAPRAMTLGQSEDLTLSLEGTAEPSLITWSSSAKKIMTVDASGKVTALKKGKAKITAKALLANGKTVSKSTTIEVIDLMTVLKMKREIYLAGLGYESTVKVTAVKNGYGKVNWSFAGDSKYATGAESDTNTADSETESFDVIVSKEAPEDMEFTVTASFGEAENKLTCSSKIKVIKGDPSIMQYENNIMNTPCDAAIEGDMKLSGKGTGYHAKFVLQNATAAVSFGLQYDQGAGGGYGGKTAFLVENITQSSQKYSRHGLGSRDEYWHVMMTYTEATDTINCYVDGELVASVKNKKFKDANGVCSVLQGSLEGAGRLEGDEVDVEFKNVKLKNCSEYDPDQYFAPSIREIKNKGITIETYGAPNNYGENRYKIFGKILGLKGKDWDSDPNNVQGVVNFSLFWK